jgi:hypothetical protein
VFCTAAAPFCSDLLLGRVLHAGDDNVVEDPRGGGLGLSLGLGGILGLRDELPKEVDGAASLSPTAADGAISGLLVAVDLGNVLKAKVVVFLGLGVVEAVVVAISVAVVAAAVVVAVVDVMDSCCWCMVVEVVEVFVVKGGGSSVRSDGEGPDSLFIPGVQFSSTSL